MCQSLSFATETVFTDDAKNESANNHDADGESIGENHGRQSSESRENRCNDKKKDHSDVQVPTKRLLDEDCARVQVDLRTNKLHNF